jgi:ABC-2 type transport system permease protein
MFRKLCRIWGVMLKEFRQIRRDRRSLGLVLFVPAFMLILFGYAITFDVKHVQVVVLDRDKSAPSRKFTAGFFQSEYFDLAGTVEREEEADWWLNTGRARAVLIIPPDFGKHILSHGKVAVQVLVDGGNANSANVTMGYLNAKIREYNLALAREATRKQGIRLPAIPITVEPRVWYNPQLESSQFLVPGLIGFLLMLVGTVLTAVSVVREKERGTMEQIIVSPVTSGEFIIGKTLPYLLVSIVTGTLIIVSAMVLFDLPLRGSLVWLFLTTVVFLLGALALGLWVSTIAETQQVAFHVATLIVMLPTLLLSGLIFPIASMPKVLQWLTYIVPPRHYIVITRSIILKGTGAAAWTAELILIGAFALFMLAVSTVRVARQRRMA